MLTILIFTVKDLRHDRLRSGLTVLGIAAIVVAYLLLTALSQAFYVYTRQPHPSSGLVILAADALDPMESTLDESVLQSALAATPQHITRAFPVIFRHLNIAGQIMQVRAVPPQELTASFDLSLTAGEWADDPGEFVVNAQLAQIVGWQPNSVVTIYGSPFTLTGLVASQHSNSSAIWLNYADAEQLFGTRRGFQLVYLKLQPQSDPEAVRAALQADPALAACCRVYLESTLGTLYYQVNHNLITLTNLLAVIALLAITFGVYTATHLSLLERSHEVGLLRVLGFSSAAVGAVLLARTLLLALAAYGVGWAATTAFIAYHRAHVPMGISAAPLALTLPPGMVLLGLALTAAFACLGTWLSAAQSARRNPLAGEG